MKQLELFGGTKLSSVHGGEYAIGKRKTKRYISTNKAMHLTARSSLAVGQFSFRRKENLKVIRSLIANLGVRYHIKIYAQGIESNHFHILGRAKRVKDFQNFQRVLLGQVAQKITKAVRGKPFGKFWDKLSFTRVIEWGKKSFLYAKNYVIQNELEASGIIPYTPRKKRPPIKGYDWKYLPSFNPKNI